MVPVLRFLQRDGCECVFVGVWVCVCGCVFGDSSSVLPFSIYGGPIERDSEKKKEGEREKERKRDSSGS